MNKILDADIPFDLKNTFESILSLTLPKSDLDSLVGANCAALSPLNADGNIDLKVFQEYYDWFIPEAGLRGLMIGGANGEGDSLTTTNYRTLLRASQNFREERGTKIIAGVFKATRGEIYDQLKFLKTQEGKYDYLMIALPLEESLSPTELVDMFKEINDLRLEKRFVLYRTKLSKTDVDINTLIKIHEVSGKKMMAVKDTMEEERSLYLEYANSPEARARFELYQGNDHLFTKVFRTLHELGFTNFGNISGGGNILPLTQLRQILVASLVNSFSSHLGRKLQDQYGTLADAVQKTISDFYENSLKPYRNLIGDKELGGRRDASILKRMITYYFPSFPTRPVNTKLKEMEDEPQLHSQVNNAINMRNKYLLDYKELQMSHPN